MTELLDAAVRQAGSTQAVEHRPWPLPQTPWFQGQTWRDLAFLHWRVDAAELQRRLPPALDVDLFGGTAWLGIVPFRITDMRLRGLPPLPGFATSLELNVRTYVNYEGRPGVWFFGLDAHSRVLVEAGRRLYRLPYERAQMRCTNKDGFFDYASDRPGAAFTARYRGHGALFRADPGSLDAFLVERYCLYTADGGRLYRADIHHAPWDLQIGEAEVPRNALSPVALPDDEPHVLFSPRQDMVAWSLQQIA